MKRTLIEIVAALGFAALLVSLHWQVSDLESRKPDLIELRSMVVAVAEEGPQGDRARLLQALDAKLSSLEQSVAEASSRGHQVAELSRAVDEIRLSTTQAQRQLASDVVATRTLLDGYYGEVKDADRVAKRELVAARESLSVLEARIAPDPLTLDRELLAPTVQLNGADTVGSGTLVFSGENPDGKHRTYVLTSYHVLRNILADTPSAERRGIEVTIYRGALQEEMRGDMVLHDVAIDAALLELRTDESVAPIASVVSANRAARVRVWDRIFAVGCPLGSDPIPTRGEISSIKNELAGTNYWMINAPTYFGNSGGGVFSADSHELIGVFSKIYTHGKVSPVVVPHMGLCTPMSAIHEWLTDTDYDFVLASEQQFDLPLTAEPPATPH